jgi:nucleoside-diphosphate-sugar epimerase
MVRMHVLVAGAGWLGSAVAGALAARGDRVTAVRRDPARAAALAAPGITPLALDLAAPGAAGRLPRDLDAVVACQSPGADGADAYRRAYLDTTAVLLGALRGAGRPATLLYTGSTGVFGQRDGGEVDEDTPPAPSGPSGEVLVQAESLVAGAAGPGLRTMVLRLSGIYGPGRNWPVERVRSGHIALGPGDGTWLNLLHLDDAVAAVLAGLDRGRPGAILHATDSEPVRRRDLAVWVAERLGIPVPRLPADARPAPMPDRRVRAEKSRAALGLVLRWPTFREGTGLAG